MVACVLKQQDVDFLTLDLSDFCLIFLIGFKVASERFF